MSNEIKPCPFCGDDESVYPSYEWPGSGKPYAIDCIRCGFDFTPRPGMDVIKMWNTRADDKDEGSAA
jgi:hypothetical protein